MISSSILGASSTPVASARDLARECGVFPLTHQGEVRDDRESRAEALSPEPSVSGDQSLPGGCVEAEGLRGLHSRRGEVHRLRTVCDALSHGYTARVERVCWSRIAMRDFVRLRGLLYSSQVVSISAATPSIKVGNHEDQDCPFRYLEHHVRLSQALATSRRRSPR